MALDEIWGDSLTEKCFKIEDVIIPDYVNLTLPEWSSGNLFEARINFLPVNSQSNDLARLMIAKLNSPNEIVNKIKDKTFKVSYTDKFNQSEFSMRLMLQFINQLKTLWSIKVASLDVCLSKKVFKSFKYPNYIIDNYKELADYKYDLMVLSKAFDFDINVVEKSQLPHYRYFEFIADDVSFSIRIDGGIAHGLKPVGYLTSEELNLENEIFKIRKDVIHDMIYNISINKN